MCSEIINGNLKPYHFGDGIRESARTDPKGLLNSLLYNFSGLGAAFVFKALDDAKNQKGSEKEVPPCAPID